MTDPGARAPAAPLDPVIHAQARLRVVATLSVVSDEDRITFPRLQQLLEMTAGNLAAHLRKLEDAGYVHIVKDHTGRQSVTWISLSRRGRGAFEDYTAALRDLLGEQPGGDGGHAGAGRGR